MGAREDGSFEVFASQVTPRLLRTAWLLTGDPVRAEDAAQEALVRLYVVWPRVRHEEPEAYCHRILRNHVVSTWRRERRLLLVEDPATRAEVGASGRGPRTSGSTDSDGHGRRHRFPDQQASAERLDLVEALRQLPTREREVVVLRYYADLSERSVAEVLGVSLGTVKSSASRGLERLRPLVSQLGEPHAR